jgi:RNA polymerase sigma factor (sigma-70 family)
MNDLELLGEFICDQSQDAFTALVQRHVGLVYCAALRQVRSPQLAEEVAQSVFTDLARTATRLKPDTIVAAWLYEVTRRTAINVVRGEARRQLREQIALEMDAMNANVDDWTQIKPLLDDAMHALNDTDRTAVLLRFFENKSMREVGETLGTTDETARKRVNRAVEHLREFFAKRGVTVGASGLVVVISANAVQAAPIGLSTTIATAVAGLTVATVGTATIITVNWLNAKSAAAILAAALIAGTVTHLVEEKRFKATENRDRALLAQQQEQAMAQRNQSIVALNTRDLEIARLRKDVSDLARLRNEITQLRQQVAAAQNRPPAPESKSGAVAAEPNVLGRFITKEQLAFAGYATPEAAAQTMVWAVVSGNYEAFTNLHPSGMFVARARSLAAAKAAGRPVDTVDERAQLESQAPTVAQNFKGLQIQARKTIRADQGVELKVFVDGLPMPGGAPGSQVNVLCFVKEGDEWKWANGTLHTPKWDENGTIEKFVP